MKAVLAIYIQDSLAYKASGIIWVLTDAVNALTMPLVWAAAAGSGMIAGYSASDFVLYYLAMLLIGSFVTCHYMWDVSWEIKEGFFSVYLIRPVSYMQFMMVRNLAWRVVRTLVFLPIFAFVLLGYWSMITSVHLNLSWEFWVSLVLGHMVSFLFVMAIAMLALILTETRSIFELYYFPMLFLSGQIFPVSVLPAWAKQLSMFFPFYFTTGVPTEILIGRLRGEVVYQMLGLQVVWIVVSIVLQKALWTVGRRHYSGAGM